MYHYFSDSETRSTHKQLGWRNFCWESALTLAPEKSEGHFTYFLPLVAKFYSWMITVMVFRKAINSLDADKTQTHRAVRFAPHNTFRVCATKRKEIHFLLVQKSVDVFCVGSKDWNLLGIHSTQAFSFQRLTISIEGNRRIFKVHAAPYQCLAQ